MKSIKQWMFENGMVNEDFDKTALSRYFGSSTLEVDQNLRRELKPKITRIMDMDDFKAMPKEDLLNKIKVVISQVVAGVGGTRFSSGSMAGRLSDDENKVNKSRFADMMGSDNLKVDTKIRRELEPKIEYIMSLEVSGEDNKTYGDLPKSDLENMLIAVASQLVAEMSGPSMSVGKLADRMDSFNDEPIARESVRFPSFLNWVENNEEQGGAVSEPQHEEGEENMDLKAVVEKKMMELAMELEQDGKGSRQDVLAAMKAVVDSAAEEAAKGGDQQGGEQQGQPDQGGQPQPQPQQGQPQPPQG